MRSTLPATFAATLAAGLVLPLTLAPAASGAVLPFGDFLWALSCIEVGEEISELYRVDPADAKATEIPAIGDPVGDDCPLQAANDPVSEVNYYIAPAMGGATLNTIETGQDVREVVAPFGGAATGDLPDAMAISKDQQAYVLVDQELQSLNLSTGVTTAIGSGTAGEVFAFAADPTTGSLYVVNTDNDAFIVDPDSGEVSALGAIATSPENYSAMSLQIDRSGAWWISLDTDGASQLWTGARPGGTGSTFALVGDLVSADGDILTHSLLITYGNILAPPPPAPPKPELAASGADVTTLVGAGAGAVLVLLAGVVLLARRRSAQLDEHARDASPRG